MIEDVNSRTEEEPNTRKCKGKEKKERGTTFLVPSVPSSDARGDRVSARADVAHLVPTEYLQTEKNQSKPITKKKKKGKKVVCFFRKKLITVCIGWKILSGPEAQ